MKSGSELKAGVFLILAVIVFIVGIWILGQEREVFSSKSLFHTTFKNVQGLSRGAPVRLSGITIGRVEEIGFREKAQDPSVHITLSISEQYLPLLKEGSVASIQTQGLLGDKFLSIFPGESKALLTTGSQIEAREMRDVADTLQRASTIINRTAKISEEASQLIKEFRKETMENIRKTSANLADITSEIKDGNGLLHELIYTNKQAKMLNAALAEMESTAKNLSKATRSLAEGTGTLGALLFDASLYDNLVDVTDEAKRNFLLKSAIRLSLKEESGKANTKDN